MSEVGFALLVLLVAEAIGRVVDAHECLMPTKRRVVAECEALAAMDREDRQRWYNAQSSALRTAYSQHYDQWVKIDRIVTGPMELVHWPDCRGGAECRCADSGGFILRGVGFVRRPTV